jgi:hypothetical protein
MAEPDPRVSKGGEYFAVYGKIFAFHKKHINTQTVEEEKWLECAADLSQFKTPFETELAVAVINELERDIGNKKGEFKNGYQNENK